VIPHVVQEVVVVQMDIVLVKVLIAVVMKEYVHVLEEIVVRQMILLAAMVLDVAQEINAILLV